MILYVFALINLLTFTVFFADKGKAVKHQRRISERTLLMLSFLGGSVGAFVGMLVFRHKISKMSFLMKFFGVVITQIIITVLFYQNLSNN